MDSIYLSTYLSIKLQPVQTNLYDCCQIRQIVSRPGPRWPTNYAPLADLLHAIGRLMTCDWPTYHTPLADLLHANGRLITHPWPTYYMQIARAMRHIPTTLRVRRAFLATNAYPGHVWNRPGERRPTYDTAWPTYYTPAPAQPQLNPSSTPDWVGGWQALN